MKNKKMLGNAILLLTAIVWGTAFVFQRKGMDHIEPLSFTFTRMYLASAALAIVSFIKNRIDKAAGRAPADTMSPEALAEYKKNTLIGGIVCGLCLSGGSIFQQIGVVYTTAGKAGFITALYILLVPIIGVIFLKKREPWLTWVAVVIGAAGLYFLSIKEGFTIEKGDAFVMICALFFSLHILMCDRFVGKGDPLRISMLQFLTVAVVTTVPAFIFETPTMEKIASAAFPIFFCGLGSGALGFTLQLIGQRYTDPSSASLIMSLESVFAAISGALILSETMSLREIAGCALMFTAIILVQLPVPERK
ncbi:MAG TPA: DMT family transporter [Bacillota bacterium]|nr:DMT family transporter [Bacillota bacterium]